MKIRDSFYKGHYGMVEPDLLIYEFANALRYNPSYSVADIKKAVDSLTELQIDIIVPTPEMLKDACETARKHDTTVYDAAFISLAKLIGARLVTADEKLYEKVKGLGFVRFISHLE